ncbi:hypothetical protein B0J17DRAFT_676582 [Rhizoctonia solani]|nr:hypothetical protein B0J17DRAFT_676582 [Rhizoctonia solani]
MDHNDCVGANYPYKYDAGPLESLAILHPLTMRSPTLILLTVVYSMLLATASPTPEHSNNLARQWCFNDQCIKDCCTRSNCSASPSLHCGNSKCIGQTCHCDCRYN